MVVFCISPGQKALKEHRGITEEGGSGSENPQIHDLFTAYNRGTFLRFYLTLPLT